MDMAEKWNFRTSEYEPYILPEGSSTYEADLHNFISCAACGVQIIYGLGFVSRTIHNQFGFGYMVCEECGGKEIAEMRTEETLSIKKKKS